MRILVLLLLNLTLWTLSAQAHSWSGIIDPSRAIDWSQAGVPGGIPMNRTQCGATIEAYSGTAATINTAIQSCGTNQYVLLGPGTFSLSSGILINKNNVTLRGSGPDQTVLVFTGHVGCVFVAAICAKGTSYVWGGTPDTRSWETSWTGGYAKGSTQLTVDSTANMAVGRVIVLDQLDDTTDSGGLVNSAEVPTFSNEGGPSGRHDTADGGHSRSQLQIVRVVSVDDGTHVTITPGVYMPNWRSTQSPEIWGWGTTDESTVFGVGIEDLSVDGRVANSGVNGNIEFGNAYGGWVKNVRSMTAPRRHVGFLQAANIEVRDCYFYGTQNSATQSYGIEHYVVSDSLAINNIFQHVTAPTIGPCQGCVVGYSYAIDNYYSALPNANWHAFWPGHDSGGGMTLVEGNQSSGIIGDYSHGNSPLTTVFRNWFNGNDDIGGKTQYRIPIVLRAFARAWNVVGNVLGTDGVQRTYELPFGSGANDSAIYDLGLGGRGGPVNDAVVASTLLRWGNYDTVNDASRFLASEIPKRGTPFINDNAVPSSQNLPASLFLSSLPPSWWATPWAIPAWPPIGPDVTGGNVPGVGGHVHTIPAKLCYDHLSIDHAYPVSSPRIKKFNAKACYGNSRLDLILPPRNLTVR